MACARPLVSGCALAAIPPRTAALCAAALALALLALTAQTARAVEPPVYRFDVRVDVAAHTISGTLELELDAADPRLGGELWFHLPPNRFLESDPRGTRRSTDSLPFATGFRDAELFDPIWPAGLDAGRIVIEAVSTGDGTPLRYTFAPNPTIPRGFSVRDGLMRVDLGAAAGATRLLVRFTTRLPERYQDGWSDAGILAEQWYPVLANRQDGAWDFDVFAPRAGRYAMRIVASEGGRLFVGQGAGLLLEPDEPAQIALGKSPLRVMPLVFIGPQPLALHHEYDASLYAYQSPEHARLGRLALEVAESFRRHVRDAYRLSLPDSRIAIVEVDVPPGDIRTVGNVLLVPASYYKGSGLLDRVFVAQIARAIAQVWFGETVWANDDTQSWLRLGLSGYLALDYFHTLFGWNAGIHNIMDWLQPKYREHFFEAPLRSLMRGETDAPLMISLQQHPLHRPALLVAHNKGPLVLRSLRALVGAEAFARALNALYYRHRFRAVTAETLRQELSAIAGRDLAPFFKHWFYGSPMIDFAIEDWEQKETPTGYEVQVRVRRSDLPMLDVDVRVVTENGRTYVRRWEGEGTTALLTFSLPERAASITIDPDEDWLEVDRKNNHTDLLYRVRPIFDWPKQRELLVTLRGLAGGNSTDGNYFGLGVNLTLNENNNLTVIPIYGARTGFRNYRAQWLWREFISPRLDVTLTFERLGGRDLQGLAFDYHLLDTDDVGLTAGIELRAETVNEAAFVDRDGTLISQPDARANNVELTFDYLLKPGAYYGHTVELEFSDSRPNYDSDFVFSKHRIDFTQTLALGSSHLFVLGLIRGGSDGSPPLQLRHELGGPEIMRGYPRILALNNEEIAAARLDYGLVLSRRAHGSAAQVRRITAFLFGDVGRGWNNDESHDTRPQRQDAGLGLELRVNLMQLVEFPLRFDLAYPLNDEEFRDPQFILFGLLNF